MSMVSPLASSWRPLLALLAGTSLLVGCVIEAPAKKKRPPPDCSVEECYSELPVTWEDPIEPDQVNTNSGAFGAAERPSNVDPGPDNGGGGETISAEYCRDGVGPGDLAIVEVMITSKSGSGDPGEWVEIQNTRDCILKLKGVTVSSPRGATTSNSVIVPDDLELDPHATFVVAGSADATLNNNIPGKVIAWNATDVLKNSGDTIMVTLGSTEIDSLTYPGFTNLTPGRSLAFPSDCVATDRKSWERWSLAFGEFAAGGFKGTPNRPNDDVSCF